MAKEKNKTELPQVMEGELQARLIKLREDAGYTVSQMADALCLSEDVIINLENENFEELAEPPYVRGYLRNYAKLGESDPSELINRYESLRGADASELDYQIKPSATIKPSSQKRLSPVLGQLILLGILLGGIALISSIPAVNKWVSKTWHDFSNQFQAQNTEATVDNPLLTGTMPVPIPLPDEEGSTATTINNDTTAPEQNDTPDAVGTPNNPNTSESSTDTANSVDNTPTTTEEATSPATQVNAEESTAQETEATPETDNTATEDTATAANPNGIINIKLVFNKDVWLRIKNKDNKTVFEGLNKINTEKTIELEKPLTFRVGNAQGLALFVDDKLVDISSYTNGSVANFTLE